MKIIAEGILDDLVDAVTIDSSGPKTGYSTIENYIYPRTAEQLYQGVVYQLRKNNKNKVLQHIIMPLFFPENNTVPDIQNLSKLIYEEDNKYPTQQILAKYTQKMEDVVIDFVAEDAVDICDIATKQYADKEITADQYFGTILKNVNSYKYDIVDKLVAEFKNFKKEAKSNYTNEPPRGKQRPKANTNNTRNNNTNINSSNVDKAVNNVYKQLSDRYGNVDQKAFERALSDFLSSDITTSSLAQLMRLR